MTKKILPPDPDSIPVSVEWIDHQIAEYRKTLKLVSKLSRANILARIDDLLDQRNELTVRRDA